MNCSQLMAGAVLRGAAAAGLGGADATETDSGATIVGGCGAGTDFGTETGLGDWMGDAVAIFACGSGAGATGGADSLSRFNREISDSSSLTRKKSSSTRLRALTARIINQTARAREAPRTTKTTKTTMGIISSINFAFRPTIRLGCVQCALRRERVASCNDAALNHLFGFSHH
jgi:hypothetical protein